MPASLRRAAPWLAAAALSAMLACAPEAPDDPPTSARADGLSASAATGPMVAGHVRGAAALLDDGRVLVSGGWYPAGQQVEVYDPATDAWTAAAPSVDAHDDHAAFAVPGGKVVLAGGTASSAEILDLASGAWTRLADANRQYAAAALLPDGRVLVTGGYGSAIGQAAIVDPAAGTIQQAGSLLEGRSTHRAVTLADGRVLLLGGRSAAGTFLKTAELFDPQAGASAPAAQMSVARTAPSATRLADGRVLVTGGYSGVAYLSSAELYDPTTNAWTPAGPMARARSLHEAIPLPDGRVAIVGGIGNGGVTPDFELFDPATGTFAVGGYLSVARYYQSSALLASGELLVASGYLAGAGALATAERVALDGCTPLSCADQGKDCGYLSNGCGGTQFCGSCGPGTVCQANVCAPCAAITCASAGKDCGWIADGCGGTLSCGTCGPGQLCSANVCVACQPTTCAAVGASCGPASDGCGGVLDCGTCGAGEECWGGTCLCVPATCEAQGASCGEVPDGCGGALACGECAPGLVCGEGHACVEPPGGAAFDPALGAPRCATPGPSCGSGALLVGRASLGPEPHAPNTLDGCADGVSGGFHGDESLDALRIATLDGAPLAAGAPVRIEADVWAYAGYSSDALDLYLAADASAPAWTLVATLVPAAAGAQTLAAEATLPAGAATQALRGVFRYSGAPAACSGGTYDDHDDLVFEVEQPADTTPPTVALTSPAAAYVSGDVLLAADASDDVGVVRVAFYDGETVIANAFSPPWQASWNTRVMAGGPRTLTAVAWDAAGNTASASRAVAIDNVPPTVVVTSPAAGAVVSGTVTVAADAFDDVAVAQVTFLDGATAIGTRTAKPWSLAWSTAGLPAGTHALTARAVDAAGNAKTSAPVSVTVGVAPPIGNATYDPVRRAPVCASPAAACDSGALLNGRGPLGPEPNASNALRGSCSDGTAGSYHRDESLDRLKVSTLDGSPLAAGKTVRIEATVWVWGAASDRLDLFHAPNADAPAWQRIATLAPAAGGLQTLSATFVLPPGGIQALRGVFRYGGTSAPCVTGPYNDVDDLAFLVMP